MDTDGHNAHILVLCHLMLYSARLRLVIDVMLCCVVKGYAMLCYAMCHTKLSYAMLCDNVLFSML